MSLVFSGFSSGLQWQTKPSSRIETTEPLWPVRILTMGNPWSSVFIVAGRVKATCFLRLTLSCLPLYSCSMYAHNSPCVTVCQSVKIMFPSKLCLTIFKFYFSRVFWLCCMSLDSHLPKNTIVHPLLFFFSCSTFQKKNDTIFGDQPFVMSRRDTLVTTSPVMCSLSSLGRRISFPLTNL